MDIKVSDLSEYKNLENYKSIGSKKNTDNTYTTNSFNIGLLKEDIENFFSLCGINEFSEESDYLVGTYALYNSKLYRFLFRHQPGVWLGNDVIETNIASEIINRHREIGYLKTLDISVTSDDSSFNYTSASVYIGSTEYSCNSEGHIIIETSLKTANNIEPKVISGYTANIGKIIIGENEVPSNLDLHYTKIKTDSTTRNLEVTSNISFSDSIYVFTDSDLHYESKNGSSVTFEIGSTKSGSIIAPIITNYYLPDNVYEISFTSSDNSISLVYTQETTDT